MLQIPFLYSAFNYSVQRTLMDVFFTLFNFIVSKGTGAYHYNLPPMDTLPNCVICVLNHEILLGVVQLLFDSPCDVVFVHLIYPPRSGKLSSLVVLKSNRVKGHQIFGMLLITIRSSCPQRYVQQLMFTVEDIILPVTNTIYF